MKVFLYEHITGGGLLSSGDEPPPSLLSEGRAMVEALAADLLAAGIEAALMRDHRQRVRADGCRVVAVSSPGEADAAFQELSSAADWSLVIAPETAGVLADCCRRVEEAGGRLVGPGVPLVEIAADKHTTAECLASANVPVPRGIALKAGQSLPGEFGYPAVLKPRHGAGSQETLRIASAKVAKTWTPLQGAARLEEFHAGTPASVAVLCGPLELRPLVPCRQHLSDDGRFRYLGGSLPLPAELAERARRLALLAVGALPDPHGYIGVDLVLGENPACDRVIEINPRLTTSYVGLRAAARQNLAAALLAIAAGERAELSFRDEPLQFDANGKVRVGHALRA